MTRILLYLLLQWNKINNNCLGIILHFTSQKHVTEYGIRIIEYLTEVKSAIKVWKYIMFQ